MTPADRELLELAAKAAGIDLQDDIYSSLMWVREKPEDTSGPVWNPLTDDGDALRLAVKLQIDLVHFAGHLRADIAGMPDVHQKHEDDPYVATRRAIVRAAAAIGKGMA